MNSPRTGALSAPIGDSLRGDSRERGAAARQNRSPAGLPWISFVAPYGAGFVAKRGCRAHCCTVGVEASAAHGQCHDASGVIVFTVGEEEENIPPSKQGGARTGVASGSSGTLLSGDWKFIIAAGLPI
jgi:hypothetical protein